MGGKDSFRSPSGLVQGSTRGPTEVLEREKITQRGNGKKKRMGRWRGKQRVRKK